MWSGGPYRRLAPLLLWTCLLRATRAECVDEFQKVPGTGSHGAVHQVNVKTLADCKTACLDSTACEALDFGPGDWCGLHFDNFYLEDVFADDRVSQYRRQRCPSLSKSTPSQACTATFILVPETGSSGGSFRWDLITLEDCRAECVDSPPCKAFDFDMRQNDCFLHFDDEYLKHAYSDKNMNQYRRQKCQSAPKANEACMSNMECQNGGKCETDGGGQPQCKCPLGWIGTDCTTSLWPIVGGAVGGAVILIIVIIVLLWSVKRQRSSKKDDVSNDDVSNAGVKKDGVNKEDVNKDDVNKGGANKDGVNKDGVIKDGVRKDALDKDVVNKDDLEKMADATNQENECIYSADPTQTQQSQDSVESVDEGGYLALIDDSKEGHVNVTEPEAEYDYIKD